MRTVPTQDDPLLDVAGRISDGLDVDWQTIESVVPGRRAVLEALRELEELRTITRPEPITSWSRFQVEEILGSGGSATVYRAFDPRLERHVALKIYERGYRDSSSRGLREARLLAQVRHPNVVTVLGADVSGHQVGVWMDLIQGQDLAALVRERGPLSARETALVGLDLCRALAAVHARGIVHGDVKAENVMRRDGGEILLMDFDIGTLVGSTEASASPGIACTPVYAAPEVLAGEETTPRSDVYSLGVLLYHLATGAFPVRDLELSRILEARRDGATVRLRDRRADLPSRFVEVIENCLEPRPEDRPRSMADLELKLAGILKREGSTGSPPRRLALVFALPLILLSGLVAFFLSTGDSGHRPGSPDPGLGIVVGPFTNTTADPGFDYGIEAAVELALAQRREVSVMPRSLVRDVSQRMRVETALTIPQFLEICRRESYQLLVAGRIEQRDGETHIEAEGRRCDSDQVSATAATGPVSLSQLVEPIEKLVSDLLGALRPGQVPSGGPPLAAVTTPSFEALRLYSKGREAQELGTLKQAEALYRAAVDEDPGFAVAWSALSSAQIGLGDFEAGLESISIAYDHRARATEPERLRITTAFYRDRLQYNQSLATARRFTALYPDDAEARRQLVHLYERVGHLPEAIAEAREATRLDPRPVNVGLLGLLLAEAGQESSSLEVLRGIPHSQWTDYLYWPQAQALVGLGRTDEARSSLERLSLSGEGFAAAGDMLLSTLDMLEGKVDAARDRLAAGVLRDQREHQDYWAFRRRASLAQIALMTSQPELAVEWLAPISDLPALPVHLRPLRAALPILLATRSQERAERIVERLEEIHRLYPSDISHGTLLLARAELDPGPSEQLRGQIREALQLWDDPTALRWAAELWSQAGRCDVAGPLYQRALDRWQESFRNDLAGDIPLAREGLERCSEPHDPRDATDRRETPESTTGSVPLDEPSRGILPGLGNENG